MESKWRRASRFASELIKPASPSVVVNRAGNALAVSSVGDFSSIYPSRFDGTHWFEPELVEEDNRFEASVRALAMNGHRDAVAAWYQEMPGESTAYTARWRPDVHRWGRPTELSFNDGSGWCSTYRPEVGAWQQATRVEDSDLDSVENALFSLGANGDAVVSWFATSWHDESTIWVTQYR